MDNTEQQRIKIFDKELTPSNGFELILTYHHQLIKRVEALEKHASQAVYAISCTAHAMYAHQQALESTEEALTRILGDTRDEFQAADLRKAIAEIDELRRLFGPADPLTPPAAGE